MIHIIKMWLGLDIGIIPIVKTSCSASKTIHESYVVSTEWLGPVWVRLGVSLVLTIGGIQIMCIGVWCGGVIGGEWGRNVEHFIHSMLLMGGSTMDKTS